MATITFRANLNLHTTETMGPSTSSVTTGILHPDRHQSSQVQAIADYNNRVNAISSWLAGLLAGENIAKINNDEFVVSGAKAQYLKTMYGVGFAPEDRAWLTIVSEV